jgi:phosphoribosylamine--glycine ligase
LGDDLNEALEKSKELVEAINFEEKYFRKDIGFEFSPLFPGGGT